MAYFLGIDGGGTKTRCLLGDENSVLSAGTSSSCKVQRVGEACAQDALRAAIHEACVQGGVSPQQITRTCAGITGAARAEIAKTMHNLVASIVGGEIEIAADVEIAFEDAFGTGPGVLVIAGTGSIAYGKSAAGETARAGGWGHAISDAGSGYWIGVEAVRAALHAHDRAENPDLLNALSNALGARDFEDFIIRLNSSPAPDFASLFPAVLGAARDSGDATAKQVLEHAGHELAKLAESVIHRLSGNDKASVAIHGGVMTNAEEVRDSFVKHLESLCPQAGFTQKLVDPARGALERARRDFG